MTHCEHFVTNLGWVCFSPSAWILAPRGTRKCPHLLMAVPSSPIGVAQSDLTCFAFNIRYSAWGFRSFERCYLLSLKSVGAGGSYATAYFLFALLQDSQSSTGVTQHEVDTTVEQTIVRGKTILSLFKVILNVSGLGYPSSHIGNPIPTRILIYLVHSQTHSNSLPTSLDLIAV